MRSAYRTTLGELGSVPVSQIVGQLVSAPARSGFASLYLKQVSAWEEQLALLAETARQLIEWNPASARWTLHFEYEIPRRGRRPDAILLADDMLFVIEFKIGAIGYPSADKWQVRTYARDLQDFHGECRGVPIVPILVCTGNKSLPETSSDFDETVHACFDADSLATLIRQVYAETHVPGRTAVDADRFEISEYRPTLSILQAAEELFTDHDIREISHCYADNLTGTTDRLIEAIRRSAVEQTRTICFVTGVPGAGKTLAGLNAVHNASIRQGERPAAAFLSGNVPLIRIVQAALAGSAQRRGISRNDAERRAKTYVQDVHRFLSDHVTDPSLIPPERAVIFDEAQRAWDAEQSRLKKRGDLSEPAQMLGVMSRYPESCVIIALVGGGQEIHQGEAGLAEWGRALAASPSPWRVLASPYVIDPARAPSAFQLFGENVPQNVSLETDELLHLNVGLRSFRAQSIADWVDALLAGNADLARRALQNAADFPLAFTRSLDRAREWLRAYTPPDRRCGLVASSGALRLRHYGLELSSGFRQGLDYEHWFLKPADDIRSSHSLETALSEFEMQGLELDYVGMCWGNDLSYSAAASGWKYSRLVGTTLRQERSPSKQEYIRNKYRVLLTRAREGMIIWIPRGNERDATLAPETFDGTAEFLCSAGVPEI